MREIKCSECGKHLFETPTTSDGAAGSEAMRLGFVFKMPFLYGISGCFFFCNKECHKEWCKKNITQESKDEEDKAIAELKAKQPQMVEDLSKGVKRIVDAFNKLKK